jgi:GxxExxY protein
VSHLPTQPTDFSDTDSTDRTDFFLSLFYPLDPFHPCPICQTQSTYMLHQDLTEKIIRLFYSTYNDLGYGFREKVYENALAIELQANGLSVPQQHPINVYFRGQVVGEYFADLLVNDIIILEIKAARSLTLDHEAQLLSYLKSTEAEIGLLFNFGIKPEFKRKLFTNDVKGHLQWIQPR